MGRTSSVDFVSNFTDRTSPSRPVMTSFTRASGHDPRGEFSSMINTTSSFLTLGILFSHFWRRCNSGKYSRTQRFQNKFAKYCTCRHLRWYIFPSFTFVHGYEKLPLSIRRWFGVKGSLSVASSLTFVIGRLLTIFSASQNTVFNTSSLKRGLECRIAYRTRRMVRIIRSNDPPWWEANGGLKTHSISRLRAAWMILSRLSCLKLRASSL